MQDQKNTPSNEEVPNNPLQQQIDPALLMNQSNPVLQALLL